MRHATRVTARSATFVRNMARHRVRARDINSTEYLRADLRRIAALHQRRQAADTRVAPCTASAACRRKAGGSDHCRDARFAISHLCLRRSREAITRVLEAACCRRAADSENRRRHLPKTATLALQLACSSAMLRASRCLKRSRHRVNAARRGSLGSSRGRSAGGRSPSVRARPRSFNRSSHCLQHRVFSHRLRKLTRALTAHA